MRRSLAATATLSAALVLIVASCGSEDDSDQTGAAGTGGASGAGAKGSGGSQGGSGGAMSKGGGAGKGGTAGSGTGSGGDAGHGGVNVGGTSSAGAAGAAGEDAGQSGAAGAAGAGCDDIVDPVDPDCDDGDASSIDFLSGAFGTCGHWFAPGEGSSGWVVYGMPSAAITATLSVDVASGVGWAQVSGSRNQANAAAECGTLMRLGLGDFRLATIDEARTLAAGCPTTAPAGTCPIADPDCLEMSCNAGVVCESCPGGVGSISPRADELYCRPEVNICTTFQTSSNCTDCATASAWRYGPTNGNLNPIEVTSAIATVCVMPNVPDGVPCLEPDL